MRFSAAFQGHDRRFGWFRHFPFWRKLADSGWIFSGSVICYGRRSNVESIAIRLVRILRSGRSERRTFRAKPVLLRRPQAWAEGAPGLHGQRRIPYLPALSEIVGEEQPGHTTNLGTVLIPLEFVVGTKSLGRTQSFSRSFMPLMNPNTEFAGKWQRLCQAHLEEGIWDPIKVSTGTASMWRRTTSWSAC